MGLTAIVVTGSLFNQRSESVVSAQEMIGFHPKNHRQQNLPDGCDQDKADDAAERK